MQGFFWTMGILTWAASGLAYSSSKNELQQSESIMLFVAAAVLMGAAGIITAIYKNGEKIKPNNVKKQELT